MSDMETEVEEVSFLPGEKILNKKAVYEPSSSQRCRQVVCTRRWAIAIIVTMGLFILLIAIIAAFARPGSYLCQTISPSTSDQPPPTTPSPSVKDYISKNGRDFPWKDIRLPRDVVPDSYEIFLHPNISEALFSGSVRIHCTVTTSTKSFVFHVKELNVTEVHVFRGEVEVEREDLMEYEANEQMYVSLKQRLAANSKIIVVVQFRAPLVNKLTGFYKSSYTTAAGETRQIATTHFEPTDARSAFPCFDEPDLKANFTLSIVREPRHITLFNMPLKRSTAYNGGLVKDEYEMSVKMSTYLVAFVVCDFKNVSSYTKQNTLVRVFAPEDQIDQANYAVEIAVKVLNYYNNFFGVPYPLPKQDMIAIPDFGAGAMENWGLITYRMTSILYDPQKTSDISKQWIVTVIAHELAHQWFGNIVTMKWWDDLWLNEGFAAFVEYLGGSVAEPSFGMEEQFVYETLQRALYLDSLTNSHPIQVKVTDPAQINEIFDSISYDKGASLIAMLRGFIGEDAFKTGLHNYLTNHAYGNARTDDLWASLQNASDLPHTMTVKDVMDTWTLQMGYPVITVKRKAGADQLTLTQSRFLLTANSSSSDNSKSPYKYVWKVPLTYRTKTQQEKKLVWLVDKEMTLPVSHRDGGWIKFNLETRGFYRVNYEPALWRRIIQQLKENVDTFTVQDRAGLLDDAFALARAGELSYDIVFELLGYLDKETQYVPIRTAISGYQFIGGRVYLSDIYPKFQKYMLDILTPRIRAVGWGEQSQHLDKLLQSSLLSTSIDLNDKTNIEQVKEQFKDWNSIPNNLRSLVYNMGVKYGDDDVWQTMYRNFTASTIPSEKRQFLVSLTHTTNPRRIQLFLRDALNEKIIRSQDSGTVIDNIGNKDAGHIFAWRFMQQNWDTLYKRYGLTSFVLNYMMKAVIAPFNSQFDYDEVKAFFKDKKLGSGERALQQSLEMVQSHIDWSDRNEQLITKWFQTNVKDNQ